MRDFTTWLAGFRSAIAGYKYYTDFEKIYRNVDSIKVELNIMNSLIGCQDIEKEFVALYRRYPEILKCIPILLAKRESDILTVDFDGEHIFNYKNPKEFGKYVSLKNYENDKILMNVISTNEQINKADYNKNIFYTDCTNPISLGFINRNFIKNGKVTDAQGLLLFDGSILKNANVDLKTISGKIDFLIHIKNNLGENFICNVSIENDLTKNEEEILNGYSMKILDLKDKKYDFLKVSN